MCVNHGQDIYPRNWPSWIIIIRAYLNNTIRVNGLKPIANRIFIPNIPPLGLCVMIGYNQVKQYTHNMCVVNANSMYFIWQICIAHQGRAQPFCRYSAVKHITPKIMMSVFWFNCATLKLSQQLINLAINLFSFAAWTKVHWTHTYLVHLDQPYIYTVLHWYRTLQEHRYLHKYSLAGNKTCLIYGIRKFERKATTDRHRELWAELCRYIYMGIVCVQFCGKWLTCWTEKTGCRSRRNHIEMNGNLWWLATACGG